MMTTWTESVADIGGVSLEYRAVGNGEPVLLVHGALIADTYRPLMAEPTLTDRYRLIAYRRRGYGGSTPVDEPITIRDQVCDARGLLRHLGVDRAHVVGHSYGGSVALQMAGDAPDLVHSMALLEPALFTPREAEEYRGRLLSAQRRFREEKTSVVLDDFLRQRVEGEYRPLLEETVPGGFAQAVADAETFFEHEIAGLLEWKMEPAELRMIHQPTLCVLGERSTALWPRFGEAHQRLLDTLEKAEGFVLPGSTHLLQLENPSDLGEALARFWARHPMDSGSGVRRSPG